MAFTEREAKNYMVGLVLIIVALIFFVRMLPYAWGYIQSGSAEVNGTTYTLSDVSGGGLITGLVVFLLVLVGSISLILKVFDLV